MNPLVKSVSSSASHTMSKTNRQSIRLLAGLGVEGDAHLGKTVQHLSRIKADPTQPNLRQVHLIHTELHEELQTKGYEIQPGQMGENITTQGIDLLGLPTGTHLYIGSEAVIEITGLRNPCHQLNGIQPGLMNAVLDKDSKGHLIRKAGIMGIVITSGWVRLGDTIRIELPAEPHRQLERV